jgi:hypothetical protein
MTYRDQLLALYHPLQRLSVEEMSRRLTPDDNSLMLWMLLQFKLDEVKMQKTVEKIVGDKLDDIGRIRDEIRAGDVFEKIGMARVGVAVATVSLSVIASVLISVISWALLSKWVIADQKTIRANQMVLLENQKNLNALIQKTTPTTTTAPKEEQP